MGAVDRLTGVRDQLREMLGAEPATWRVVETTLEVVADHLATEEPDGERADASVADPDEVARALRARGLPTGLGLDGLLDHERTAARMLALQEVFDEAAERTARAGAQRAAMVAVRRLLDVLDAFPGSDRTSADAAETVSWFADRLRQALTGSDDVLDEVRTAERERVVTVAAEVVGLTGMARLEWVARLNAALADG